MVVLVGALPDVEHARSPAWTHFACDGTCADGLACNQVGGSCEPADDDVIDDHVIDVETEGNSTTSQDGSTSTKTNAMDVFARLVDALHKKNDKAGDMKLEGRAGGGERRVPR